MKINQFVIIVCCVFVVSCNWRKAEPVEPENTETATPEVLLEEEKSTSRISFSDVKRFSYKEDMIEQLYEEALEKDATLKELNDKIVTMSSVKNDSLQAFNNYKSQNEKYWEDAKNHIAQIEDEALKASTTKAFEDLEKAFYNKIAAHENAKLTIQQKTKNLQDRFLVMKLMITQAMMNNYQNNEFPNIESMKGLIKEYDKLIKEVEAISQ